MYNTKHWTSATAFTHLRELDAIVDGEDQEVGKMKQEAALDALATAWNPYLTLWKRWAERAELDKRVSGPFGRGSIMFTTDPIVAAGGTMFLREDAVRLFSWAIPTRQCIAWMVSTCPRIVEIGSGNGYWAAMLSKFRADVVAVDKSPKAGKWYPTEVVSGENYLHANEGCPDRALFLCWPHFLIGTEDQDILAKFLEAKDQKSGEPLKLADAPKETTDIIGRCIDLYRGKWIFYVGEESGGCTYDIEKHLGISDEDERGSEWVRACVLSIPNWVGIYDRFVAYKRRRE